MKVFTLKDAMDISLGYHNKPEFKDVFVTFPDQSIYVDCKPSDMQEHLISRKLTAIVVKENGKLLSKDSIVTEVEVSPEAENPIEEKPKKKKK